MTNESTVKTIAKTSIRPLKSLDLLSHHEIDALLTSDQEIFELFRQCALAVLNTGNETVSGSALFEVYPDFEIQVVQQSRGLKLHVFNAPSSAFVDGSMLRGVQEHLFAVLRDIVFTHHKLTQGQRFDLNSGAGITDAVFRILRNADTVLPNEVPSLVVCWGGHSIDREEYEFSKEVGYELGLRGLNIATGCGIGAMKGPMKGATIGHAKQQNKTGRYIGISEPGIIASESPNPIVNQLIIMPDIEKRLEAFVRLGHCIVVFPGGAGTAEEVLYLLSILMHPNNKDIPFPLIFAAPEGKEDYFKVLDTFISNTLGPQACNYYSIITGAADKVARLAKEGVERVHRYRRRTQEAYCYNWRLWIDESLQNPFEPTHYNMRELNLSVTGQTAHELASSLRSAFSGIVAGNVKSFGIDQIKQFGPYQLRGDAALVKQLDVLLSSFVQQRRMALGGGEYVPCYELVS